MTRIVVIAASEGGLDPLCLIVSELPMPSAAVVFIVWHIGQNKSLLPGILSSVGKLDVQFAYHGALPLPGCVYVAPPDRHVILYKGRIVLSTGPKVRHTRPAADPLFISAAEAYGRCVLGVVLSGGGGDGARGLRIIKEHGGVTLVQTPVEAVNPGMPTSAMLADHPDGILSVADISQRICDFCAIRDVRSDLDNTVWL